MSDEERRRRERSAVVEDDNPDVGRDIARDEARRGERVSPRCLLCSAPLFNMGSPLDPRGPSGNGGDLVQPVRVRNPMTGAVAHISWWGCPRCGWATHGYEDMWEETGPPPAQVPVAASPQNRGAVRLLLTASSVPMPSHDVHIVDPHHPVDALEVGPTPCLCGLVNGLSIINRPAPWPGICPMCLDIWRAQADIARRVNPVQCRHTALAPDGAVLLCIRPDHAEHQRCVYARRSRGAFTEAYEVFTPLGPRPSMLERAAGINMGLSYSPGTDERFFYDLLDEALSHDFILSCSSDAS